MSISWLAMVVGFYVRVAKQADRPFAVFVLALLDKIAGLGLDPVKDHALAIGSHGLNNSFRYFAPYLSDNS